MPDVLVATDGGLHRIGGAPELTGRSITALSRSGREWWAIADGRELLHRAGGDWAPVAKADTNELTCLLASPSGVLMGTAGAHLLRLHGSDLEPVSGFDDVGGREEWHTPWGGPADTRSMAAGPGGEIYVNVHVGGIVVSVDGGESWEPTAIDIHADVHEVLAAPDRALAAAAAGLGESRDGGRTWQFHTAGLHGTYLRAVAVAGDQVLVTASTGPRGERAALYRRPIDDGGTPFEKCSGGLPEWFEGNINTGCLATADDVVAFGTHAGQVFVSADAGETWEQVAAGLPSIQFVALEN